jgi:pyrroloquinoline quinone (PQQ) biosynthesis protein C
MQQMGADTQTIQVFLSQAIDKNIFNAIENAELHPKVKSFLNFTFDVAINQPAHIKAAVFTFGREDLIPDMFVEILREIHQEFPEKVSTFKYYIERHIEVDGDHHSHLALEMVAQLCGDDAQKWSEAEKFSIESLKQRSLLWDAIIDR